MLRSALLLIGLVLSGFAAAQESADPPERVARLSFIRGEVTFQALDTEAPEQALLNRPVTTGDRIMTGNDSRAELTLGTAAVRLDARTDLSVANLDSDIAHLEINSGTVGVTLRELQAGNTFEVDVPNGTVRLLEPGDYRVEAAQDGAALLDVRSGSAEIDSGAGPTRVASGQRARLGSSERVATLLSPVAEDDFDRWGSERERQLKGDEPRRYVSRDMVGFEDLDDRYGRWHSEPGYGSVWFPTVVAGWSPYTVGRWIWVSPWGWTWIDSAPWGFAPFHYGRWAFVRHRWCWVPGPRHRHPVYAPAHVAWVGGHRDGFSRGHRPIGWFPLGPREVYVPGHRVSPRYLRNVNIGNAHIDNNAYITNVYRNRVGDVRHANRNIPGAFRTMPRESLAAERPVPHRGWRSNPEREIGIAPTTGSPNVEPLRRFRIHKPASAAATDTASPPRMWRSRPSSPSQQAWQASAPAEAVQPSRPRGEWRTQPRQWGHGVRIPDNDAGRRNSERTYGNTRSNDGARTYGSPIRYGSAERSAPSRSAPRYSQPSTPRYSVPSAPRSMPAAPRQSQSHSQSSGRGGAAASRAGSSNGASSSGRSGRAMRQSY